MIINKAILSTFYFLAMVNAQCVKTIYKQYESPSDQQFEENESSSTVEDKNPESEDEVEEDKPSWWKRWNFEWNRNNQGKPQGEEGDEMDEAEHISRGGKKHDHHQRHNGSFDLSNYGKCTPVTKTVYIRSSPTRAHYSAGRGHRVKCTPRADKGVKFDIPFGFNRQKQDSLKFRTHHHTTTIKKSKPSSEPTESVSS